MLKTSDTCVFQYSYSIDSHVNMASKRHKVLILDEPVKAIQLVESGKVAEEFGVDHTQIQETMKQCRP